MKTGLAIFGGIVALIVLFVAGYAINWYWQPFKGRLEARTTQQSGNNRIGQNSGFEKEWADIKAFQQGADDARLDLKKYDAELNGKTDVDGCIICPIANRRAFLQDTIATYVRSCQRTAASYNADARAFISSDFKAHDLPEEIDLKAYCN